jgi:mono/diheme cytochrome c family protein
MLRGFLLISLLITIAAVAVLGFRGEKTTNEPWEIFPDMVRQMKVRAQSPLNFFADGRGPRMPIAGTVPIGYEMPKPPTPGAPESHSVANFSVGTDYIDTGKMGNNWGTGIPVPVTLQLLQRGRERFNITCAMCHGATAAGNGITKSYGLATVVTLQDDRIRKIADGEIFNTITNGKNTMMAYGPNIMVADRWAIIAYLRALQRSQGAAIADVPPEHRADLEKPAENKPPEAKPGEAKPTENKSPAKPEAPKK